MTNTSWLYRLTHFVLNDSLMFPNIVSVGHSPAVSPLLHRLSSVFPVDKRLTQLVSPPFDPILCLSPLFYRNYSFFIFTHLPYITSFGHMCSLFINTIFPFTSPIFESSRVEYLQLFGIISYPLETHRSKDVLKERFSPSYSVMLVTMATIGHVKVS